MMERTLEWPEFLPAFSDKLVRLLAEEFRVSAP